MDKKWWHCGDRVVVDGGGSVGRREGTRRNKKKIVKYNPFMRSKLAQHIQCVNSAKNIKIHILIIYKLKNMPNKKLNNIITNIYIEFF